MKPQSLTCLFLSILLFASHSFADARKSRFKNSKKSQYLALGGNYSSDQNSKEYRISGSYQYSGEKFIHEIDLLQQSRYAGTSGKSLTKNRDLYDMEVSSKILIAKSTNYFNYYNRSRYDEFSNYYYDTTNAAGWGRMFFDGIIEADINIGYNETKNFDSQIIINPNLKANLWLTERLRLNVKAFLFKIRNSYSEELKTRLSYKMTKNLWLELHHNYDKRRFFKTTSATEQIITEVDRDIVFRIRYNF
ncbi:MAG: hypothetical protein ACJA0S_000403 [Rickettsiales bacterium]|jgi:hypothetical protein